MRLLRCAERGRQREPCPNLRPCLRPCLRSWVPQQDGAKGLCSRRGRQSGPSRVGQRRSGNKRSERRSGDRVEGSRSTRARMRTMQTLGLKEEAPVKCQGWDQEVVRKDVVEPWASSTRTAQPGLGVQIRRSRRLAVAAATAVTTTKAVASTAPESTRARHPLQAVGGVAGRTARGPRIGRRLPRQPKPRNEKNAARCASLRVPRAPRAQRPRRVPGRRLDLERRPPSSAVEEQAGRRCWGLVEVAHPHRCSAGSTGFPLSSSDRRRSRSSTRTRPRSHPTHPPTKTTTGGGGAV